MIKPDWLDGSGVPIDVIAVLVAVEVGRSGRLVAEAAGKIVRFTSAVEVSVDVSADFVQLEIIAAIIKRIARIRGGCDFPDAVFCINRSFYSSYQKMISVLILPEYCGVNCLKSS